jgi:hypothetical protein
VGNRGDERRAYSRMASPRQRPTSQNAADFDLELLESRTLDGHTQELVYRPTLHV